MKTPQAGGRIYCEEYRDFDDLSAHLERVHRKLLLTTGFGCTLRWDTGRPEEFERDWQAATQSANGVITEAATVEIFHSSSRRGSG